MSLVYAHSVSDDVVEDPKNKCADAAPFISNTAEQTQGSAATAAD